MPNIKSAKKRVKVNEVKTLRNKGIRSNLKTTIKKAELALANNDANKDEDVYKRQLDILVDHQLQNL